MPSARHAAAPHVHAAQRHLQPGLAGAEAGGLRVGGPMARGVGGGYPVFFCLFVCFVLFCGFEGIPTGKAKNSWA